MIWKLVVPLFTALALGVHQFHWAHIQQINTWFPYGWHGARIPACGRNFLLSWLS